MEITQMYELPKELNEMTVDELRENIMTLKAIIKQTESAMEVLRLSGIYHDYNDRFAMDDAIKPIVNARYDLLGRMKGSLELKLEVMDDE